MAGITHRPEAPRIPTTESPVSTRSFSSQATTPAPAINRFSLLLQEQRCLVKNAQEGLQQSLAILQRASSKEEQESARLQVQSLLPRAEEMVITLQVIMEIKAEVTHMQKELKNTKAIHKDTLVIRSRLQWLEQRLERLLMARRRSRPAARGRRAITTQTQADFTDPARQKSQQLLPHLHHGQPSRFTRPVANKRAARVCMIVSEAANENSQESPSHPSTQLSESPYSDIDSFAAEVSTLPPGGSHKAVSVDSHKFQRSDSLYSSRRSASRDSDVWHSESEANWTMVEANSTAITQSQVLTSSDDEREQQKGQTEASCSRQHSVTFDEPPSKIHQYELPPSIAEVPSKSELIAKKQYPTSTEEAHLPRDIATPDASVYGFETPRPLELYGPCSWNSLTLAVNSNLVKPSESLKEYGLKGENLTTCTSMMQAGLEGFFSEVQSLRQMVCTAAMAATEPGVDFPPEDSTRKCPGVHRRPSTISGAVPFHSPQWSGHSEVSQLKNSTAATKFPPLDETPSYFCLPTARKVYGKQGVSDNFPRPTQTWIQHQPSHHRALTHPRSSDKTLKSLSGQLSGSWKPRNLRKLKSAMTATGSNHKPADYDIFDTTGYQKQSIKHLLKEADSPLNEVRRDAVQALGTLSHGNVDVESKLAIKLQQDADPAVRYLALKSLIDIGKLDASMLDFISSCLVSGSVELQCDILKLLCGKEMLLQAEGDTQSWDVLIQILLKLVHGDPTASLFAAVVLSLRHVEKDTCLEVLMAALHQTQPHCQSLALSSLVNCWHCHSGEVIECGLEQMEVLHDWRLRVSATETLRSIGERLLIAHVRGRNIFDILLERLVNEPMHVVRVSLGKLLADLHLSRKAKVVLLGRLESHSEVARAEAVVALSAFELCHKIVNMLLDCLELDPSVSVRIQVVRLLGRMNTYIPVVIHRLLEKSRGTGLIARVCQSALQGLDKVN